MEQKSIEQNAALTKSSVKRKLMARFVAIGIAVAMLFAIVALSACNYIFSEDDLKFTIEVNKTEARVNDTIIVTATLKNLSDRNIRLTGIDATVEKVSELISIVVAPYGTEVGFFPHPVLDNRTTFLFRHSDSLNKTISLNFDNYGIFQIHARVAFYFNEELFAIYAEQKNIYVENNKL